MRKYNLILLCLLVLTVLSAVVLAQAEEKITSLSDADQGGFFSGFKSIITRFVAFLKDEEYQPGAEKKTIGSYEEYNNEIPKQSKGISAPSARPQGRQAPTTTDRTLDPDQRKDGNTASVPTDTSSDDSLYDDDVYYDDLYDDAADGESNYYEDDYNENVNNDDYTGEDLVDYSMVSEEPDMNNFYEEVDESLFEQEENEQEEKELEGADGTISKTTGNSDDFKKLPTTTEQPKPASKGRWAPATLTTPAAQPPQQQKRGFFGRLTQFVKQDGSSENSLATLREDCKHLYDSGDKTTFMKKCKSFVEQMNEGFSDVMPEVDSKRLGECTEIAASGDKHAFKEKCPELFDRFAIFNNEDGRGIPEHAQFCKKLADGGHHDRFKHECPEFVGKLENTNNVQNDADPNHLKQETHRAAASTKVSSSDFKHCKELYDTGNMYTFKEKCSHYEDKIHADEKLQQHQQLQMHDNPTHTPEEKAKCRRIYEHGNKELFRQECSSFLKEAESEHLNKNVEHQAPIGEERRETQEQHPD